MMTLLASLKSEVYFRFRIKVDITVCAFFQSFSTVDKFEKRGAAGKNFEILRRQNHWSACIIILRHRILPYLKLFHGIIHWSSLFTPEVEVNLTSIDVDNIKKIDVLIVESDELCFILSTNIRNIILQTIPNALE